MFQTTNQCFIINGHLILVGGWALPLWKMMEWKSVGMMTFPICGKSWNSCSKPPTRIYMTITSYQYIYIYINDIYHHVFIVLSKMAITGGDLSRSSELKWHRLLTSNRLTRSDKKPGDGQWSTGPMLGVPCRLVTHHQTWNTLWWTYKKLLKMAIYSGFSH